MHQPNSANVGVAQGGRVELGRGLVELGVGVRWPGERVDFECGR